MKETVDLLLRTCTWLWFDRLTPFDLTSFPKYGDRIEFLQNSGYGGVVRQYPPVCSVKSANPGCGPLRPEIKLTPEGYGTIA